MVGGRVAQDIDHEASAFGACAQFLQQCLAAVIGAQGLDVFDFESGPGVSSSSVVDDFAGDAGDAVDGDRESESDAAAALAEDHGVYADDLSHGVDEGAAAVAGVDGGVGLDEVLVEAFAFAHAGVHSSVFGGDDSDADGGLVVAHEGAEGVSDGDDPFADEEVVGVSEGYVGKAGGAGFEDGEVGAFVGADDVDGDFASVRQCDGCDFGGVFDDVVVGDDVSLGVEDEAAADGVDFSVNGARRCE